MQAVYGKTIHLDKDAHGDIEALIKQAEPIMVEAFKKMRAAAEQALSPDMQPEARAYSLDAHMVQAAVGIALKMAKEVTGIYSNKEGVMSDKDVIATKALFAGLGQGMLIFLNNNLALDDEGNVEMLEGFVETLGELGQQKYGMPEGTVVINEVALTQEEFEEAVEKGGMEEVLKVAMAKQSGEDPEIDPGKLN